MIWKEGEYWLRDAVKHVRFPPDRKRVQDELYEHMISRNLDFLAEGYSDEEADLLVCAAMGDPEEVGKALAEVHKPFWGYFLRAVRIVTAIVLVLFAVHFLRNHNSYGGNDLSRYTGVRGRYEAYMAGWIGQSSAEKCGDYRFRLLRAGTALVGEGEYIHEGYQLALELRASTWDPGLGTPQLESRTLTVEDSLGKRYDAFVTISMDWIFFSDIMIVAYDFDPAAEWAVLSYDAGELAFHLPVELEAGV